jgi:hypothetical protein
MSDEPQRRFSRRGMEKMMADLEWALDQQEFESADEAEGFVNRLAESSGGTMPSRPSKAPADRAQDLGSRAGSDVRGVGRSYGGGGDRDGA